MKIQIKNNLYHNGRNYKKGEIVNISGECDVPDGDYIILEKDIIEYGNKMINQNSKNFKRKKQNEK